MIDIFPDTPVPKRIFFDKILDWDNQQDLIIGYRKILLGKKWTDISEYEWRYEGAFSPGYNVLNIDYVAYLTPSLLLASQHWSSEEHVFSAYEWFLDWFITSTGFMKRRPSNIKRLRDLLSRFKKNQLIFLFDAFEKIACEMKEFDILDGEERNDFERVLFLLDECKAQIDSQ